MENLEFQAKNISKTYGWDILKLLYDKNNLCHGEICKTLSLSPSSLNSIINKMISKTLVIKETHGKYSYYSLPENIKEIMYFELDKARKDDLLKKTLFLNMLKSFKPSLYVTCLLKDISYTFDSFSEKELEMLFFVLGLYNFEEGQSLSSLFDIAEEDEVKVQRNLLCKFLAFFSRVLQKYNMIIPEEEIELKKPKL